MEALLEHLDLNIRLAKEIQNGHEVPLAIKMAAFDLELTSLKLASELLKMKIGS